MAPAFLLDSLDGKAYSQSQILEALAVFHRFLAVTAAARMKRSLIEPLC